MRKLLFGMIAVCCIQAAFLFYNSTENGQSVISVYSVAADPQFQTQDEIISTWPRAEIAKTKVQAVTTKKSGNLLRSESASVPAVYRRQSSTRAEKANSKPLPAKRRSSDAVFASNLIRYDDSLRIEKPKIKRSFASKTFSVVKKPYDWLKALGSKLN